MTLIKKLFSHLFFIACLSIYLISNQLALAEDPVIGLQVTNSDDSAATPATTDHYYTLKREDAKLLRYTPAADGETLQEYADLSQIFSSVKSVKTGAFDGAKTVFIAGVDKSGNNNNKLIKFTLGATPADTQSNADTNREEFLLVDGQALNDAGHSDFRDIAIDAEGRAYVTDVARHRVIRIDAYSGQSAAEGTDFTVIAGTGLQGFSGDSQVATEAQLDSPNSIAFDRFGNLIIADTGNGRIRAVKAGSGNLIDPATSTIESLAGKTVTGDTPTQTTETLSGDSYDAGTPLSVAVDINNDIRYYDKDSEHWIRITNDGDGNAPGNLNYSQRSFSRLSANTVLHSTNGDVYNGAIVTDWQQNNVTFLTDNLTDFNSNIYAGATTDPASEDNHSNALDIKYQNAIKEIEFDQEIKLSTGEAYANPVSIEFLKNGSTFDIDFQPQADMAVGDKQVLFSITDEEGVNYFGNSLVAVLNRTSATASTLSIAVLGHAPLIGKEMGTLKTFYDKDGKLRSTELSEVQPSFRGGSYVYKVLTTINLSEHVRYDDWNKLKLSISEFVGGSNVAYYQWSAEINNESTTASSRKIDSTVYAGYGSYSVPGLIEHYQVPDTCYAETWRWEKVEATAEVPYEPASSQNGWQEVAHVPATYYMKPTELIAKHPFKCFKDKDGGEATDIALKPEYCDLGNDISNTTSSSFIKYQRNQYPGYRDAMHCYKNEQGEIYSEPNPYFSPGNVLFRSFTADYHIASTPFLDNSSRFHTDEVVTGQDLPHKLLLGATGFENALESTGYNSWEYTNTLSYTKDSVLITSYPINYYLPNDTSRYGSSTRSTALEHSQNNHNAWPGNKFENAHLGDIELSKKYYTGLGVDIYNGANCAPRIDVADTHTPSQVPFDWICNVGEGKFDWQVEDTTTTAIARKRYNLAKVLGYQYPKIVDYSFPEIDLDYANGNFSEMSIDDIAGSYYGGRLLQYAQVHWPEYGEVALRNYYRSWPNEEGGYYYSYKNFPSFNANTLAPTVPVTTEKGTFYLHDSLTPPFLDPNLVNQEPVYTEPEHFYVKSVVKKRNNYQNVDANAHYVDEYSALGVGVTFKGGLKIGGFKKITATNHSAHAQYNIPSDLKNFKGLIANFKITQDEEKIFERINVELTSLATGSLSSDKPTLTIQGKNSSPSLYKIVGSDTQPKIFEIDGSSYTVKVPKYIAIDTQGRVYYNQTEAETAERDNSDVVLKEVHTLSKVYPPLNNELPINRTTIDEESVGEDVYELSANITDSNHKMFVEYVAQFRASVSTIRPLSSTSQDAQIVFSDAYAGLPIDMVGCPVARLDPTSFNSRKSDEISKHLQEQKTAGKSAFTFAEAMGDVVFEIGTVFCRSTEWVSSDQVFDPEVQGIVYNPADDAGKRYRLVRVKASGTFGNITKDYSLTDDYNNLVNQAKAMDGATDITYIWAEQYRVNVNTTKSKASGLARIRIGGEEGTIVPAYAGNGEFWIDKGTQVELLMPVTSPELQLEGYTFRQQGQDDSVFDLVNNTHSMLTIDGVEYFNINIGQSQGIKTSANVTWDFGNKVYKFQVKIGEKFVPDVTTTSDGVAIPAKAIQAIQGADHDPAFFVPLSAQSYIDQETGLVTPAPESPALTGKTNAYVWQNRSADASSDFKGAMYFTRPGVYQMEWFIGGVDYPIEGTEGFQKLIAEVVVNWPDESGFIPHIGGTPDVPLEVSEGDGLKFKALNYAETDHLKVDLDSLQYPEWFGDTSKTYRSVLVFTQSTDDRPAQGNVDSEAVVVKVVKSRHWTNQLEDNVSVNIGSEIVSPLHDDDVGHNGYLLPLFGDGDVDQAMYNAATYNRETRIGELFAVNEEADPTDSDDDLVVVWYKRLGDTSDANDGEPLIESEWPAWPHQAVRYVPQWPQGDRIVIAGRQGSDGKKTSGADSRQLKFSPALYSNLTLYNQADKNLPGYNPNEEHALITKSWRYRTETPVPDAAFALRNDLNNTNVSSGDYTSQPYVLVQYQDRANNKYGMNAYRVDTEDAYTYDFDPGDEDRGFNYTFNYDMEVGQTVIAPYPLNNVIGANKLREIWGENVTDSDGNIIQQTYWEDRNGIAWAISGGSDAKLYSYFWYPVQAGFWHPSAVVGDVVPFGYAGSIVSNGELNKGVSKASTHQITYNVEWPENTPELRIGETLTFSGGEHKTDNPGTEGLPGAIGWASGEIVFDSLNPTANVTKASDSTGFSARLSPVLREIKVSLPLSDFPDDMKPATKRTEVDGGNWYFAELHAGIKSRIYYDNTAGKLVLRGFVNDKSVGDETLQAAPPVDYILQANALTNDDFHSLTSLSGTNDKLKTAITRLYALSQQPTISGNALYGRQAPEVPALEYSDSYKPAYHLGLSRFLRASDNRLLTVRGSGDIVRRMQNGQLPMGLTLDDVELINPETQYDYYSDQVDSSTDIVAQSKADYEAVQSEAKLKAAAYANAAKKQEADRKEANRYCKKLGDSYHIDNNAELHSGLSDVDGHINVICSSAQVSAYATWEQSVLAVRAAKADQDSLFESEKAAKALFEDLEKNHYTSSLSSLVSLPNPEASELPYGFTVEDLETINALKTGEKLVRIKEGKGHIPASLLGSGLALMTNPNLLDPTASFDGGYVVVAENNDPALDGNPVSLHIVKINDKPFRGMIKTVFSDNVFDEKISLRHTGDFGGNPEDLIFDWRYVETAVANSDLRLTKGYKVPTQDADPSCPVPRSMPDSSERWKPFVDERPGNKKGVGWNELTFGNATGKDVLVDNSFFVRYIHKSCDTDFDKIVDADAPASCKWSGWTGAANGYPCDTTPEYQPQLVTGWVKRVTENVNQYDARINNFSTDGSPATYVSMIQQAGQMHEGDVALNPDKDVIENMGLIELYQTVLNRAKGLSIEADQTSAGVTQALQNAASRISQFYSLLGNEAYSDALDPTIGFASNSREYGTLAPTVFTFQNQLSSLGEEELALLRGRPEKGAKPAYNRLLWNFTNSDGEAAYALSYNIQDVDKNGEINEADGRAMYPQGHGDAWGHYLSGLSTFYDLLRHPIFTWETRSESYQIEGVTLDVDYLDERRFAEAAAYKAKAGAEVVTQTYRERYVEDVDGQWQGYKDTDSTRAWGVDGWARRAHQGAYYDWVTAAALIPAKSRKTGIQKIDRTTVGELQQISVQGIKVLTELAQVDNGLNPLGLLPDVVPFDIAPGTGTTHFEQIVERAESAIDNATNVFDYSNDLKHRLRKVADTQQEFTEQVDMQDREYRNRLIEIFGTPYAGTIGAGKAYPEGYQGADYKFYQYIDVAELSDKTLPVQDENLVAFVNELGARTVKAITDKGDGEKTLQVFKEYYSGDFPTSFTNSLDFPAEPTATLYPLSKGSYAFSAPTTWEQRKVPGGLQSALADLVKMDVEVRLAAKHYSSFIDDLWRLERKIKARSELREITLEAKAETALKITAISLAQLAATLGQSVLDGKKELAERLYHAAVAGLPTVVGTATDPSSVARLKIYTTGAVVSAGVKYGSHALTAIIKGGDAVKGTLETRLKADIAKFQYDHEIKGMLSEVDKLLVDEPVRRMRLFSARENLRQSMEKYRSILGKGLALLDERDAFHKKVAFKTHGKRYQDMAFRINRTEASQKYRASFELAAKYVYLAAKAYDYDTNLSTTHPASATPLLSEVVRARSLGQFYNGEPVVGMGGLADVLARLKSNYGVLKTQMGINNPQLETMTVSLRKELFRINDGGDEATQDDSDARWKTELLRSWIEDIWTDLPEYRTHMRPFTTEAAGAHSALVIPFATNVISGQNLFGRPLGSADHAFDASHFATRIHSVGVSVAGYNDLELAETLRAYLVPVGQDVMYVPDSDTLQTREWDVQDQKIPAPLLTGRSDIENPDWLPLRGLDGSSGELRRHSRLRVYDDSTGEAQLNGDTRLFGRSVWNNRWLLVIPRESLGPDGSFRTFIYGKRVPGSSVRDGKGISDIKLTFKTYAYSGE